MAVSLQRLNEILEKSKHSRIAVFGDLMLDVYLCGSASRLSQEAPVPVLHVKNKNTRLGGAANVMRNLASLSGCTIRAFGVTGCDNAGKLLKELLEKEGVNASGVVPDSSRRTTEKQRVIAGNQQLVRMDFEDTHPVATEILEKLAKQLLGKIVAGELDAVIFEDYAKGLLDKNILQTIVDKAAEKGVFTSLDPHPGHDMQLKHLSLMTPNRVEAFGLAGIYHYEPTKDVERDENLKLVARKIIESWLPESLLVTLGHQGMALFEKGGGGPLVIPTIAREVFDVSGAGDTVIATYTLCMSAGATSEEAAVIANHAAGIVVGKIGTAVCSPEELQASFQPCGK